MTAVITVSPRRRRLPRLGLSAFAAAVLTLLAACGSGSPSGAAPPAGSPQQSAASAGSTAIPTQDVVSGIRADPALHAQLPAAVRTRGTLTLGTTLYPGTAHLPHNGQNADGQEIGLDVDLRNAVAKVLGVTWNVQNGTLATVIPGVQNGRLDVGQDDFGVTTEREKVVDFATYLTGGQSFLGAQDVKVTRVTKLTDLCGLTIATTPGSTFQQILTKGAGQCGAAGKPPYTVQYFTDTAPIFLGLANGKVDVYFGATLTVKYDATHMAGTRYLGQLSSTPVGFVTAKGSPLAKALRDAVNELIKDGTYTRILAKWGVAGVGIDTSRINPPTAF